MELSPCAKYLIEDWFYHYEWLTFSHISRLNQLVRHLENKNRFELNEIGNIATSAIHEKLPNYGINPYEEWVLPLFNLLDEIDSYDPEYDPEEDEY